MNPRVYCTVPSRKEAEEVVSRMQREGFKEDELVVADQLSEIEGVVLTDRDYAESTIRGAWIGALLGAVTAIAELAYINSPALNSWSGVAAVPIFNALGWGLYGMIAGGTGILARRHMPSKLMRHFEEQVAKARLLVSIQLHNSREVGTVTAALTSAGATDIQCIGSRAA
jgi:hypothetical protein